jgi:hypothetical protein
MDTHDSLGTSSHGSVFVRSGLVPVCSIVKAEKKRLSVLISAQMSICFLNLDGSFWTLSRTRVNNRSLALSLSVKVSLLDHGLDSHDGASESVAVRLNFGRDGVEDAVSGSCHEDTVESASLPPRAGVSVRQSIPVDPVGKSCIEHKDYCDRSGGFLSLLCLNAR